MRDPQNALFCSATTLLQKKEKEKENSSGERVIPSRVVCVTRITACLLSRGSSKGG
jgi:hypothetical protein